MYISDNIEIQNTCYTIVYSSYDILTMLAPVITYSHAPDPTCTDKGSSIAQYNAESRLPKSKLTNQITLKKPFKIVDLSQLFHDSMASLDSTYQDSRW